MDKVIGIVLMAGGVTGGIAAIAAFGFGEGGLLFAGIGSVAAFIGYLFYRAAVQAQRAAAYRNSHDFEWYKATYPEHVSPKGVSCFKCKRNKIALRRLLNRTFSQSHTCVTCGTTLYYSHE